MSLFKKESFVSHSGIKLDWKIECDALFNTDYETLAYIIGTKIAFDQVYGIPTGGLRLAKHLKSYSLPQHPYNLLVDDVATTGNSFEQWKQEFSELAIRKPLIGVVLFDRTYSNLPNWVFPVFKLAI